MAENCRRASNRGERNMSLPSFIFGRVDAAHVFVMGNERRSPAAATGNHGTATWPDFWHCPLLSGLMKLLVKDTCPDRHSPDKCHGNSF